MNELAETTRVYIKFGHGGAPDLASIAKALVNGLEDEEFDLRGVHGVVNGLLFDLGDLSLTIVRMDERPDEVRVIAMGPDDGLAGSPLARSRFRACTTVARQLVKLRRPARMEWRHRGGFYINEGGQVAVVSGMRGTTGEGARRKAAARAFSLYGHDGTGKDANGGTGEKSNVIDIDFQLGGRNRQRTPIKIAQYAVNATVCVLSLPVGAAIMTHDLLGGGSLTLSARWMALTGTGVATFTPENLSMIAGLL